jgi:hypothetical protein
MHSVKGSFGRFLLLLTLGVALAACEDPAASSASSAVASSGLSDPSSSPASSSSTASSGSTSSSTPAPAAQADSVTLSWAAPTENTDGSALTNLAGFEIYYGNSASSLTQKVSIDSVGLLSYVVPNLNAGTWYFQVVAVNSAGVASGPSSLVSVTI